ncbi:hypothetical protein [Chitinophaga jiangningensis]|nr:hypothetical protein [Chitinophaga jiangningensis]
MTNKQKRTVTRKNALSVLHALYTDLPIEFRERVCKECKWSIPTFYRKMRIKDIQDIETKAITPALSNAEKDKIIQISEEVYKEGWKRLIRPTKSKVNTK